LSGRVKIKNVYEPIKYTLLVRFLRSSGGIIDVVFIAGFCENKNTPVYWHWYLSRGEPRFDFGRTAKLMDKKL